MNAKMLILIALLPASQILAQAVPTFKILHCFDSDDNGDFGGAGPMTMILSGDMLFGTTPTFKNDDALPTHGTVFRIKTDGTGFKTLHTFEDADDCPLGDLIMSHGVLYGRTYETHSTDQLSSVFAICKRRLKRK